MVLPTNIDATYDDSVTDASQQVHQQHHDALHALYNTYEGTAPADFATAADITALDTRVDTLEADTTASDHIADAADAHDASAISIVDAGAYFTGTDVEAALQELGAGGGGGGGGGVAAKTVKSNSSSTTFTTASAWANLSSHITISDITLTGCSTGDLVGATIAGYWGNEASITSLLDVATIVGGTLTNYLTSGTSSPSAGAGFRAWQGIAGTLTTFGSTLFYVLQAGDISSGSVTFRPRVWTDGNKTLYHDPLQFTMRNFGPAQS